MVFIVYSPLYYSITHPQETQHHSLFSLEIRKSSKLVNFINFPALLNSYYQPPPHKKSGGGDVILPATDDVIQKRYLGGTRTSVLGEDGTDCWDSVIL